MSKNSLIVFVSVNLNQPLLSAQYYCSLFGAHKTTDISALLIQLRLRHCFWWFYSVHHYNNLFSIKQDLVMSTAHRYGHGLLRPQVKNYPKTWDLWISFFPIMFPISLSLSLLHTHIEMLILTLSLTHTHIEMLILSLSLTHTHIEMLMKYCCPLRQWSWAEN